MPKSLMDRIIDRLLPMDKEAKAYLRTRTQYVKERRDYFAALGALEREKNERERAKIKAEEDREERLRTAFKTVATYDTPGCSYPNDDDGHDAIEFDLILSESVDQRKIHVVGKWGKNGRAVDEKMLSALLTFAKNQSYWTAWFKPWLEGTLSLDDLRVLKGFRVIGEKLKEPHPDAYSES